MAERVVKVTLAAQVNSFIQGMEQAALAAKETASEADALAKKREAFEQVGRAALTMGAVAAAGVGLAVAKWAEFDASMSGVQAATHESTVNMGLLRDAALEAGQDTAFTAGAAALAVEELAKAGVSTADILGGGLKGALDLAAAGELEVGAAAEIAASALTQFNLKGADVPHVADLLAAGAGKAQGSVDDMSQALNQSGLVASQMGLSLEETTGSLAAFASAGLMGSDAGTSFRNMLLRLANPTAEAGKLMEELGIHAYDAQGDFVGVESVAGQLQDRLGGLSQAQRDAAFAQLFGNDAIRAANVLYSEGDEGIRDWITKVDDSGYAAETARLRMDNLKGDVEKLGGAFDTALIQSGSSANDVLRGLTQGATALIDAYAGAPAPVQATGMAVGGVVAAVGLVGGATMLAVPKLVEFKLALQNLGTSAGKLAKGAGLVTGAVAAVGFIVSQVAAQMAEAEARAEAYADTLVAGTHEISDSTREMVAENLQAKQSLEILGLQIDAIKFGSAADAAEKLGISMDMLVDASLGNVDALREIEAVTKYRNRTDTEAVQVREELGLKEGEYATAVDEVVKGVAQENDSVEEAIRLAEQKTEATKENTEVTKTQTQAYIDAGDEVSTYAQELQKLVDMINEANGVGQDAISTNASYQQTLADVDETIRKANEGVEGFSLGLDDNTAAGSENLAMLADMAEKSQTAARAQFELDGNTKTYGDRLRADRQTVIDRARALGATAEEAEALADKIYKIPSEKEFEMIAETRSAQEAIDTFIWSNDGRSITLNVDTVGRRTTVGSNGGAGGGFGFADGGTVPAVGGPKSDSVIARLSAGEEVIQNPYASFYRRELKLMNEGRYPRYASGGTVAYAEHSRPVTVTGGVASGDTFQASFNVVAQPGRPVFDQVSEAADRMKLRRRIVSQG